MRTEASILNPPAPERAALEAGADPNASALFGGPILLDAIRKGPPEVARLLLEAGARHPRDPLGQSGLGIAAFLDSLTGEIPPNVGPPED